MTKQFFGRSSKLKTFIFIMEHQHFFRSFYLGIFVKVYENILLISHLPFEFGHAIYTHNSVLQFWEKIILHEGIMLSYLLLQVKRVIVAKSWIISKCFQVVTLLQFLCETYHELLRNYYFAFKNYYDNLFVSDKQRFSMFGF